jgi:hypothetical protein
MIRMYCTFRYIVTMVGDSTHALITEGWTSQAEVLQQERGC